MFVKISALTGEGIDLLLEAVSLQSEILELKASKKGAVSLANYQENRIRAFHDTLEMYLFGPDSSPQ